MALPRSVQATRVRIVDDSEIMANRMDKASGSAPDAYAGETAFASLTKTITVRVWDFDMYVRFISEDGTVNDEVLIERDTGVYDEFEARGWEVRNATPGSTATYQIVATYREV